MSRKLFSLVQEVLYFSGVTFKDNEVLNCVMIVDIKNIFLSFDKILIKIISFNHLDKNDDKESFGLFILALTLAN